MTPDAALALIKAWSSHVKTPLRDLEILPDGAMRGLVGSAGFEYRPAASLLIVRGFVYHDGEKLMAVQAIAEDLKRAEARESSSMGGGFLDVDQARIWDREASLTLRRDYRESVEANRFVADVQELVDASTYWRKVRLTEVLKYDEADLIRQWEERQRAQNK